VTLKNSGTWTPTTAIECVNVATDHPGSAAVVGTRLGCSTQNTNIFNNLYEKTKNYVAHMTSIHNVGIPFTYQ